MTEQIHSSIIQAICKVQSGLGAVKKSQKNVHGGYMFASTDDIFKARVLGVMRLAFALNSRERRLHLGERGVIGSACAFGIHLRVELEQLLNALNRNFRLRCDPLDHAEDRGGLGDRLWGRFWEFCDGCLGHLLLVSL